MCVIEFSPFCLLKQCAPAVSGDLSLNAEVSFVSKAAKRDDTNLSEDKSFLLSAWLHAGSAGVRWSLRQGSGVSGVLAHTEASACKVQVFCC